MHAESMVCKERFLSFARRLALVTGCSAAPIAACAGGSSGPGPTPPPQASNSVVASNTSTAEPTPTGGPCRCSWDTNAAAAPRVCKKGEQNYDGVDCIPGGTHPTGEGYYHPVPGPLPPPDLPFTSGA